MDQSDRELISGLFERMRTVAVDKDQDAEGFIHGLMRQNPNSPYLLVQTVLVHEHALQNAEARIRELEQDVERLRQGGTTPTGAPKASAGFTGAAASAAASAPAPWEAPAQSPASTSVPATKASSSTSSSGWWSSKAADQSPTSPSKPPPYTGTTSAQGMSVPPPPQNPQPNQSGSGFGGFMRQAATTATGVAGGMLIANSLSGLFGGGSSSGAPATAGTAAKPAETAAKPEEHGQAASTSDASGGQIQEASDASDQNQGADSGQPAMQDASHSGGWDDADDDDDDWGNNDFGGGDDYEI